MDLSYVSETHDEVFRTTSEFFLASMASRREDPVAAFGGRTVTAVQPFGAERLDSIPTAVVFAGGLLCNSGPHCAVICDACDSSQLPVLLWSCMCLACASPGS